VTATHNREEWFRAALSSIGDAVIATDAEGRVVFLNAAASSLTGWAAEQAAGQPLGLVFRLAEGLTRRAIELPARGRIGGQAVLVARDGTGRPVEGSVAPIRDDAGAEAGAVIVCREVSRPPPAEASGHVEEARRVGEQLRRRNEELAAAARRKDEFLAMLAHELRNPLAPISNGLQILKAPALDPRLSERARDMMERQIRNLTRIVDDLLEVSRLTRGRIDLQTERLDLGRLARDEVEDHRTDFERAQVGLDLHAPEVPAWVVGDPTRLGQVLDNLLANALKFTGPGGRVTVRVGPDEARQQVRLVIEDTGVGIEPEVLTRLFDVFAQADRSLDRSQGGLGLGLALVKGLVELHGGTVRAASAGRGRGAQFTVALPASPELAAVARLPAAAPPPAGKRLRILVVEDNHDSAESLRLLLQMFGHEVSVAYTGTDGVQAAKRWHPDVVLCDIGLPGLDGYGVVGELRRDPETATTPAIAVTGYGAEEDRRRSRQAGFNMHLVKPADPDELREVLNAMTDRENPAGGS
jgi:PAS domain S-box-containing protein